MSTFLVWRSLWYRVFEHPNWRLPIRRYLKNGTVSLKEWVRPEWNDSHGKMTFYEFLFGVHKKLVVNLFMEDSVVVRV